MEMKKAIKQFTRNEQIYQLTTLVAGNFSLQEVLDRLTEAAVKILDVKACSIRLLDTESGDLKMQSTYGLSAEYRDKGPVSKEDTVIKAAFAGQAVVLDDMRVDDRVKYKQATIKEGLVSQLTVAMQIRDKPIGVLRLYSPRPKRFDDDDIALARAVASQCAVAVTNAKLYTDAIQAQRMAEQMRLAALVQRRMIPDKAPSIAGLDVAATYIPCFELGGDFYDFARLDENSISLAIADVIGKGIPAAIMTSSFRGTLKAYSNGGHTRHTVDEIIDQLNRIACKQCRGGEFITLFYAIIDVKNMTITYCNCGHEPAALIRACRIIELEEAGLVLGILPDTKYCVHTVKLKDGDCLLFYTDGLIDAVNFDGQFWGKDRLLEVAKDFAAGPANRMVKNILLYRRRFVGLADQVDDTSIVVVKVDRTAPPELTK